MKVLITSMFPLDMNTSATIQNKGIIKGLYELGYEISLLTTSSIKNSINYDDSMNDIDFMVAKTYRFEQSILYGKMTTKKRSNDVEIEEASKKSIIQNFKSFIKKIVDQVFIYDPQKFNIKKIDDLNIDYSQFDIILSLSDPKSSHLIAKRIYKKNPRLKARWIQYWGDPMLHDITRKNKWNNILVKNEERKLIKAANKVVYASPFTLKTQQDTYPRYAHKMDFANQVCSDNLLNVPNEINKNDINISYIGAYFSNIRNLVPLYESMKSETFSLNIVGPTDLKLANTSNVKIEGKQEYYKTLELEKNSNVLISICNLRGTQIPGKIYYNSGYNKPLIVIVDGEDSENIKKYLESFDRFIIAENNENSIKRALHIARNEIKSKKQFKLHKNLLPKSIASKIIE